MACTYPVFAPPSNCLIARKDFEKKKKEGKKGGKLHEIKWAQI
jgi:hypothetical protein